MKKKSKSFEGILLGASRISVGEDDLIALLNIMLQLGESYRNIRSESGIASVELAYPAVKRVLRLCSENGINAESELLYGIPYHFIRLLRRPGLIAGFLAAIFIFSVGSSVIWDVRVEAPEEFTEDEIKEIVSEHGVYPGVRKSELDVGRIQADIESTNEGIAWISVNVIGTVAYVEVIEEVIPQFTEELFDGVNLVASCDGMITGFDVISGMLSAEIGQTVRKGELLVSGVYDSKRFGYRAVEAKGSVYAQTEEKFEVEIPYEYSVRQAKKSEICEIFLNFFALRQKIFKKGGFSGMNYDIIYSDIYIYNSGEKTLPVGLSVGRRNLYTEEVKTRSIDEAVDLAYLEINRQIISALPNAEILSKSYFGEETADGNAYRLVCRVNCIRDIAEAKPFNINLSE